jgi:hypothetical protein
MTDRAQFEAMLEALINEDQETAKEIFHKIVVGKSREIYQELLESDFSQDQGNPYAKEEEEEEESVGDEEEDKDSEEKPFGGDDSEEDDSEDDSEEDDSEDDGEEPEFDDEEGGEDSEGGDMEDRVMDLEDALEDLKAEFEQLLAGEENEEENEPGIHGDGEPMHDLGAEMGGNDELDDLMEYVIKVADPKHGDNGVNTKSAVAGKNDMGGTTANIAKNFSTTSGGTEGGLASTKTQPQDAGNVNVPGAKSATKLKSVAQGHGAEKAGKKETADNKKSAIGGKIR